MAKVALNPILEKINGQIGDLVFKRYEDKVILSRKPTVSDREPTAAQQAARDRFRAAAVYGKMVMADPALKAIYVAKAQAKRKPVFSLMMSDYLNVPTVSAVDLDGYTGAAGDVVAVSAYDDFEVTEVTVSLADDGGTVLESGAAVVDNGRWLYTTTTSVTPGTTVTVTATALDRPGNSGSANATKLIA
jgi:archaellum component FlaF (FlaF/FlaG flagellin family)